MTKIALGSRKEASEPDCIRAVAVEFISTFLFIFISVATVVAAGNLFNFTVTTIIYNRISQLKAFVFFFFIIGAEKQAAGSVEGLFMVAIAQAFFVAAIVSAAHISGGHLNPAVTLGLLVGGHISAVRSALYWIVQLLASSLACFLVRYLTGGMVSHI